MRAWRRVVPAVVFAVLASAPAFAEITARDVLNRMTEKERVGYITGAIDMALFLEQARAQKPTPRSECILKWFYGQGSTAGSQVVAMFDRHPGESAVGLIDLVINRACGKEAPAR